MPLKGIAINDPIIADVTLQQQIVIPGYVDYCKFVSWAETPCSTTLQFV